MSFQRKWRSLFAGYGLNRKPRIAGYSRKLRFEQCEDRCMLAAILVDTASDIPIVGKTTLREAIVDANNTFGHDTITFAPSLDGATIKLEIPTGDIERSLDITSSLTIDATALPNGLTIDGQHGKDGIKATGDGDSVFVIFPVSPLGGWLIDVTLAGLTITGGDATGATGDPSPNGFGPSDGIGGGITLRASAFNSGRFDFELLDSVVTDNHASNTLDSASDPGAGGIDILLWNGISGGVGEVSIKRSVISDNSTDGPFGGGGIHVDRVANTEMLIEATTVSGNRSTRDGGGLYASMSGVFINPTLTIRDSTFSDNVAEGSASGSTSGYGGGAYIDNDNWFSAVDIVNSTFSGNEAAKDGGGLYFGPSPDAGFTTDKDLTTTIRHTTITDNKANNGGGIYGHSGLSTDITLSHTIVSDNHDLLGADDNIAGAINATASDYNLTGTGVQPTGGGNITNENDPGLLPLAFTGGLTQVHLPDPTSSLAIDAGNLAVASPPLFDQRGTGYDRIVGGRIDIGAVESNLGTSAAGAPQVENVIISGSTSTISHPPYDFEQVITTERTRTTPRTGIQLQTVPVGGADTIAIEFSEGVTVTANDLLLVGMRTGRIPTLVAGGFDYDANTHTATWQYSDLEADDMYVLSLADGEGPTFVANSPIGVHDSAGNALDGEWTNPASRLTSNLSVSTFPSGDGTAGGDFKFVFTLLGGDADLDGVVGENDAITHAMSMYVLNITAGGTFTQADFDGDGDVDGDDEQLVLEAIWGDINLQDLLLTADLNGDEMVDFNDIAFMDAVGDYLIGLDESIIGSDLFSSLDANDEINQSDVDHFFAILDSQLGLMFAA